MKPLIKTFIISVIIVTSFASCDRSVVFEKNVKLQEEKWHKDSIVEFSTSINDTTNLHNIYLNLRHSRDYEFRNFYLFFETLMPDGKIVRDTLECLLADKSGKWHGKGFGRIKSNRFHFRENVWFPKKGDYTFRMQQAMRKDEIEGIINIGVRIEKK
ncbi:MAG: gliding motility lipoprotein GldH [Bacteroidales bacterium]